ncbi:hypothetical protein OA93_15870 [Flavobacterium sp. KMS]|uniref:hypothetical protein n=1 Tax=Flavobacterium sp. KMS TaxID=1566023 RepID=UPI00057FDDA1|nr:hypothetical protein [Flavobacterium sp. KMS]KIA97064.1 hypothetical protein OA93_15870 [Flavobacterium sp. KMS]
MKKYIICIVAISIFVSGCSSAKDKYNALNNYFDSTVKDSTKEVIVINRKYSPNITLEVLKGNKISYINVNGVTQADTTFYKEKDWKAMKKKYGRIQLPEQGYLLENEFWTKEDFRHKKIIFEHYKTQNDLLIKYMNFDNSLNFEVYFFSDPIYYHKRKYLIFTAVQSRLEGGGNSHVVIMEKKHGKWVQTHIGYPDWFN